MFEVGLYVVATPIGHLDDITFRAVETLKKVSFILAEDTRVSRNITQKYGIETMLVSYRDQNHNKMIEKAIEKLSLGLSIALISDSGTPTISDPGYKLVRDILNAGYKVITIPGPSAVVAGISISGLPTDRFSFLGFLPKSDSKRHEIMKTYCSLDNTVVVYESPNRLLSLLEIVREVTDGERMVSVINNMTKLSENVTYGTITDVIEKLKNQPTIKGEFVVLIAKEGVEVS